VCGERKMTRKLVTKQRRGGRGPIEVIADVCENCGEKYFDLDAVRAIES
jgi:hypothetical protein